MKSNKNVVYIGPEQAFLGLTGTLIDAVDPATHKSRLHFQPESAAIRPVPCDPHDVESVDPASLRSDLLTHR
jgi:hypothetical protein